MRLVASVGLALGAVVLGAAPARAAEPLDPDGWRVRLPVALPAGDSEWVRLDVPPQLFAFLLDGVNDLRLVDATGAEVERVVVAAERSGDTEELSVFARSPDGEPQWLGLLLPGPGDAPSRLTVVTDGARGGAVRVEGAFDPAAWHPVTALPAPERATFAEVDVPLPPFAARLLRVHADGVQRVTAAWSADGSARRADLEPLVLRRTNVTGGVEVSIDLRVRRAPGLSLAIEFSGETHGAVRAVTSAQPGVGFGDKLDWRADQAAPTGSTRGEVRAREARRWIKLTVPAARPDDVRVVGVAGSITPYRILFRRAGVRAPVSLLAGKGGLAPPTYPLARAAVAYGLGSPARVDPVPWPAPLRPPLPTDRQAPVVEPERPFPWAPLIATLLFAVLSVLSFLVRSRARA